MSKELSTNLEYKKLLTALKQQVRFAQTKAALSVNAFLIKLYCYVGSVQQVVGLNVNVSRAASMQLHFALNQIDTAEEFENELKNQLQ